MKHFTESELRRLRNNIPVKYVIETLLQLPHKEIEGVYRFLCPACNEFQTGLNPHTNLARCFRCRRNFNPIELLMADRGLSFVQSVTLLLAKEHLLSGAPRQQQGEFEEGFAKLAEILQHSYIHPVLCAPGWSLRRTRGTSTCGARPDAL